MKKKLLKMTQDTQETYCIYPECGKIAEYDSPASLCEEHWRRWFDCEFDIENRKDIVPFDENNEH